MRLDLVSIIFCLVAGGLSACSACQPTGDVANVSSQTGKSSMNREIGELRNGDVEWHGTTLGFHAALATDRAERLSRAEAEVIPELIKALSDPNKFVAAHVLLTSVTRLEYSTFPSWNGLQVDIKADGQVIIDPEQRHQLARRWKRWYQTSPRPSALPAG